MTSYHKLSYAILCLGISQFSHALTFGQPNILSTKAQLLYMEIPYQGAISSNIQADIADDDDLVSFDSLKAEITSDLNVFLRSTGPNTGVITVTSSRPIYNGDVRFVLKAKDGNGQYLKLIELPFKVTHPNQSNAPTVPINKPSIHTDQPLIPITILNERQISKGSVKKNPKQGVQQKSIVTSQKQAESNNTSDHTYTVKQQDTLWSISARIAQQTNQSIYAVMQQIQQMNQHAFIHGNKNRIKKGAVLDVSDVKRATILSKTTHTEMTVIADKNANSQSTSNELTTPKQGLPSDSKQQKEVTSLESEIAQLEHGLQNKNIKLEILDAKLAKIQELLKQQNAQKHAAE
ncbi:LysM peptidoglycan-binding domain-containing protein [Acinetobacter sp. ESL0695]|uniref:FimV/HubP family polar landmark protein n=1 Tax=Acinetobacter sp. ESL0695 TaxID=2983215 RepID=UPI0023F4C1BC|nr:FimV/HubP family polar landmark protein [Acinetobacter sp. ESL0695]WEV48639.1 LysM peptidoglycan-binding domain-containing protein [Acinetobacter sp. ESL0695]